MIDKGAILDRRARSPVGGARFDDRIRSNWRGDRRCRRAAVKNLRVSKRVGLSTAKLAAVRPTAQPYLRDLQREAGNRALAGLIELQRKTGSETAKEDLKASGPKNPNLAAWWNAGVVGRVKTAATLIRAGKKVAPLKELNRSIEGVRKLVDIYTKENPLLAERLKIVGNQIWVTTRDLQPAKSRAEIADFAEGETAPRLAKMSDELT